MDHFGFTPYVNLFPFPTKILIDFPIKIVINIIKISGSKIIFLNVVVVK